ncbi:hypothetical protein LVJ94_44230 [Pendulispora rubella]|uniref:VCBS repeat-containing protein n=1 Tax=Pendulispora rubella TaxID=2741070 RepID=A0ABZ2KZ85_9BACT
MRFLGVVALLLLLLAARDVHAASALQNVAAEVAKGLTAIPPATVVIAAPAVSDVAGATPGRMDELSVRIAGVVAGKLGGTTRAHERALHLSGARAVAGRGGALLFLSVEIARGELRVTADLYPVMSNGWDRIRIPAPPPRAHTYTSVPIDAEVRAFFPAISLEQASVRKSRHEEGDVLAVACGDANGDGGMELVLVSKTRVAVGTLRGGRFVVGKAAPWPQLARRLPIPLREPLAGAAFVRAGLVGGTPRLLVGTTEREAVALDAGLGVRATLPGIPMAVGDMDGCASVNAEASAFEGDVTGCALGGKERPVRLAAPVVRFDAVAAGEITSRDGSSHMVVAAREPGGKLRLRLDGGEVRTGDVVGAQLAVGDLDLDGASEIVTSGVEADDVLQVLSWTGDGTDPVVRKKIPAPGGVRALTICPPEARGIPALVAVVGPEVWVVR